MIMYFFAYGKKGMV